MLPTKKCKMNLLQKIKPFFFSFLLLLFYLSDGIAKYFYFYRTERIDLPKIIKIIVILLFLGLFVYLKKFKIIIRILVLLCIFIVGQYALFGKNLEYKNFIIISKYIFPLILLEFSYLYFKKINNKWFFNTFKVILIINSVFVIIGFLLKLRIFKTYSGERFGYDGLFLTSAGATFFYVIAAYYLYISYKNTTVYIQLLTLFAMILVGTKAIYLFLMFLILYHYIFKNKNISIKKILFSIALILLLVFLFFALGPDYLNFIKKEGLLTSIISYRDHLLLHKTIPYIKNNWNFINFIFGGIGSTRYRSQLGFIDLFFTMGILGSILYLKYFYKALFKHYYTQKNLFITFSLIILIFLGGNFFYNASIPIYLVILQQLLIKNSVEKLH